VKIPKGGITIDVDSGKSVGAAVLEKPVDIEVTTLVKEPKKEKEILKPKEQKEREAVKIDKKKPPEPAVAPPPIPEQPMIEPVIPEPPFQEERDARAEVLSAFEEGVTTRIPLDAIKQYTEPEEPVELKEDPVLDTVSEFVEADKKEGPPSFAMGSPDEKMPSIEEMPLRSSADVDATQVYNIQELMEKAKKKEDKKAQKEKRREKAKPSAVVPSLEQDEGPFFDVKIPPIPFSSKTDKEERKDGRSEDVITGDDVMDQLDNIFDLGKK
jgi:hypothetical protein